MKKKKEKKPEEGKLKDLFLNYLKEGFDENYVVVDEDVLADNGKKDFDYLLKSRKGKSMALEITQVSKSSLSERPITAITSKLSLFETFFRELLNNGNDLPSIIFTIAESEGTDRHIRAKLKKKSQSLKQEIVEKIQTLSLNEKHVIYVAKDIHIMMERGSGDNRLQFHPYSSHIAIMDFDDDRYECSEEFNVHEQLKKNLPEKFDSLDYAAADERVLLIVDTREKLGTDSVLKEATIRYIKSNSSKLTHVDQIFICCWNYEEKRVIFDQI